VTDGPDYIRDSRKPSALYEDKYYSDNDAAVRGAKSRARYVSDLKYTSGDLRQWQKGHLDTYGDTTTSNQVIYVVGYFFYHEIKLKYVDIKYIKKFYFCVIFTKTVPGMFHFS
jgi:hypothetical protein